jgi:signal transduction histidine kinase
LNDRARQNEIVHDIRNRLAVARANIEAFIDGKLDPSPARLKVVLQSLDQLAGLLNDFKPGAAVDAEVKPVEIDVCQLLDKEYRALEPIAADRGISLSVFRCAVPVAACKRFLGDPVRIGQIVSNVLINAVRYTPRGGAIRVDCSHAANELEISIGDTGPGVAPEEREAIFKPGVRGTAGKKAPGTGHGLAIAKAFVEAHGGSIEVGSSDPGGARFTVKLPGTALPRSQPTT